MASNTTRKKEHRNSRQEKTVQGADVEKEPQRPCGHSPLLISSYSRRRQHESGSLPEAKKSGGMQKRRGGGKNRV